MLNTWSHLNKYYTSLSQRDVISLDEVERDELIKRDERWGAGVEYHCQEI